MRAGLWLVAHPNKTKITTQNHRLTVALGGAATIAHRLVRVASTTDSGGVRGGRRHQSAPCCGWAALLWAVRLSRHPTSTATPVPTVTPNLRARSHPPRQMYPCVMCLR